MKLPVLIASGAVLAFAVANQTSLPRLVENHLQLLKDAQSLTAVFTVQNPGGAATTCKVTYSKPNLLKWENASGFTLSDGKVIYAYNAQAKTYSETPFSEAALGEAVGVPDVWGWASFFVKDAAKNYRNVKVGSVRNLKGNNVTEVSLSFAGQEGSAATLYVDSKLGVARGFSSKLGDKEVLVIASELTLGKEAMAASAFAWQAPEGSKKYEAPKPSDATFAQVLAIMNETCMPCHDSTNHKKGYDLSNYQGIRVSVVPGDPARSKMIRSVKGTRPQMPKDRPPLTPEQIATLEGWISNGAKEN